MMDEDKFWQEAHRIRGHYFKDFNILRALQRNIDSNITYNIYHNLDDVLALYKVVTSDEWIYRFNLGNI
jgi:hypothetical protein